MLIIHLSTVATNFTTKDKLVYIYQSQKECNDNNLYDEYIVNRDFKLLAKYEGVCMEATKLSDDTYIVKEKEPQ